MPTCEEPTSRRAPFTERVEYFCWDQRRSAEARDISPDDIFLRSSELLPKGSMVTLRLQLPGGSRGFTVLGRVAFVTGDAPLGMGITFLDIAPRDRDRILEYVERRPSCAA